MSARASILPVFVPHLGCPHQCVFCDQRSISGQKEAVSADTVRRAIEEAAALSPKGAGRQLAFYGGSFTAVDPRLQEELLGAAREALDRGEIESIRLSTRPDAIDWGTLERLKRFGVRTVELGAQSMDEEVLRLSERGHSPEDVRRAASMIREAGFELVLQMMTGLPGDTEEKCAATAKALIELHPNAVRIYPTVIVKGTRLHAMWLKGEYREHSVEEAVAWCARILPLFDQARIPVIRLGLNPTEELSGGEAVAGAYHPALGELVKSRILLEKARACLAGSAFGSEVTLGIGSRYLSQLVGQKGCNREWLLREFSLKSLRIIPLQEELADPILIGENAQNHEK